MGTVNPITAIGQGYSLFRGSAKNTVLSGATTNGPSSSLNAKIYICTKTEDVLDALNINAAAEISCAWGSFKDRMEYSRSMTKHTNSVTILAVASKVTGTTAMNSPSFTREFATAEDLYEQAGDGYVASITWGGQYIASYQFLAADESSFESVVNTAETELSGSGVEFKGQLSTAITNIHNKTSVTYQFNQQLVGFGNVRLPTDEQISDFVLSLGTISMDNPAIVNFSTQSYSLIDKHPQNIKQMDKYRDIYLDPFQPSKGLGAIQVQIQDTLAAVENVATMYANYGCLGVEPKFSSVEAFLGQEMQKIVDWLEAVDSAPATAGITTPAIDPTTFTIPVAQYTLFTGPSGGGGGGGSFDDVSYSMVAKQALPVRITIHGNKATDGISVGYMQKDPNTPRFDMPWHGGGGGDNFPDITFGPGEFVNKVTVLSSSDDGIVKRITIETNRQTHSLPNSPEGNVNTVWTCDPSTECFIGFAGSAGGLVDRLSVRYVKFLPAQWNPVNPFPSNA